MRKGLTGGFPAGNPLPAGGGSHGMRCLQSSSYIQVPQPKLSHEVFFPSQKHGKNLPLYVNIFVYMTLSFSHYCSGVSLKTGIQTSKFLYKACVKIHFDQLYSQIAMKSIYVITLLIIREATLSAS